MLCLPALANLCNKSAWLLYRPLFWLSVCLSACVPVLLFVLSVYLYMHVCRAVVFTSLVCVAQWGCVYVFVSVCLSECLCLCLSVCVCVFVCLSLQDSSSPLSGKPCYYTSMYLLACMPCLCTLLLLYVCLSL